MIGMDLRNFANPGETLESALARVERLRTCVRKVRPCPSCLIWAAEFPEGTSHVRFLEEDEWSVCACCDSMEVSQDLAELEQYEREDAFYASLQLFEGRRFLASVEKDESKLKDFLTKTSRSVSNVANSAKEVFTDTVSGVEQRRRKAAISVESKALGIRDSAIDLATAISGSSVKIMSGVTGTVTLLVDIGITVVAIVAPVPTVIGLALLWVMKAQLTHSGALIDQSVSDNRERRKLERVTGLLKKYGKIPETATLETDLIRVVIDSKKGEVTGRVLAGEFHDRELSSLSDIDIERLMSFAPDADTKSIVEAYQSFRQAQASGKSAPS